MKNFYTLLLGLLLGASAIGQETPAITMTTTLPVGSTISIDLAVESSTTIQIDFGNNVKSNEVIQSGPYRTITGIIGSSQTIKIYGKGIINCDCYGMQINYLDVSNCPTLFLLYCYSNQLTTLDVSHNSALEYFICRENKLTSLYASQNNVFKSFQCAENQLTFATIPIIQSSSTFYGMYNPQEPIKTPKDIYTGTPLDLNSQYIINGHLTTYNWRTKPGGQLVLNTDYNISNGYTTFLKPQTDSVFCTMTNDLFPNLSLTTTYISVKSNKKAQTITFNPLPAKKVGDPPFTLSATASSSLSITYTSSNSDVASIAGNNTVNILKAGTVTITASQSGDSNWEAASATQTLTITAAAATKKAQTITFDPIPAKKVGDAAFDLKATATSSLGVTFTSDNSAIASISGTRVTILKAGTVTITASQSGNGDWNAAEPVTQTLSISKKAQTINFEAIPAKKIKDAPFTLKASSSSNLPITFTSSDLLVASVNGSTVTILKAGTVTITATQAGNEEWETTTTSQKLTISATTGIKDEKEDMLSIYPNPVKETLYIKGQGVENTNASIFNAMGTNIWSGNLTSQSINVSQLPAGIYLLRISNKNEAKTIRFEKK